MGVQCGYVADTELEGNNNQTKEHITTRRWQYYYQKKKTTGSHTIEVGIMCVGGEGYRTWCAYFSSTYLHT